MNKIKLVICDILIKYLIHKIDKDKYVDVVYVSRTGFYACALLRFFKDYKLYINHLTHCHFSLSKIFFIKEILSWLGMTLYVIDADDFEKDVFRNWSLNDFGLNYLDPANKVFVNNNYDSTRYCTKDDIIAAKYSQG